MAKKIKPEAEAEKIEEVTVNEEIVILEESEDTLTTQPKVVMSPEAIESHYQAHLEKIKAGGK